MQMDVWGGENLGLYLCISQNSDVVHLRSQTYHEASLPTRLS